MIGRRAIVALGLVGTSMALAGLVLTRLPGTAPGPSDAPTATASRPVVTPSPDEVTVRSYPGAPLLPGPTVEPAGRPTQSRLWSIDGTWYGVAIDPGSRESRIATLSADGRTWTDSGVLIDARPGAMVDALWDGTALVTVSAVPGRSTDNGVRLARFRRDDTGRFVRDPNFPVPLTERGVSAATVARDGEGRLWASFVQDGKVLVAHSTTDDALWVPPMTVPGSTTVGGDDLAAVVALGDGRTAVAWSDASTNTVWVAIRSDDTDPSTWAAPESAFSGLTLAPRPISVAGAEGRIVVGIQTTSGPDAPTEPNDPDSIVAVRDPSGTWRTALTSRVSDRLGTPIVAIDASAGDVYAFLTSPRRAGVVYLKRSPIDRLDFTAGRGLVLIDDPSAHPLVASVSTMKSPISLARTFVVQGLDEDSGIPWHGVVGPSDPGPLPSPATSTPTPAAPGVRVLIDDDFAPWPAGSAIGNGWTLRPADGAGTLVAAGDTTQTRHAALRSGTDAAIRACKAFAPVADGELVVDIAIRADAMAEGDVTITSIRSGPDETASVRFGQGGTFAYYAGATKVRTSVPNRLGRWLHSRVTVHLDDGTYDWRLAEADGADLVVVRDVPFRQSVDAASSVCVGTSSGPDRPVVHFDDLRVAH